MCITKDSFPAVVLNREEGRAELSNLLLQHLLVARDGCVLLRRLDRSSTGSDQSKETVRQALPVSHALGILKGCVGRLLLGAHKLCCRVGALKFRHKNHLESLSTHSLPGPLPALRFGFNRSGDSRNICIFDKLQCVPIMLVRENT